MSRTDRVTMADVARHAGVSVATVSRALNGIRAVDPDLQERVLDSARQLGYRVNLVGRTLRRGRSAAVGLIVPDLNNPFFSSLAQHLSDAFADSHIDLLIYSAAGSLEAERRGVNSFVGRQVEALVTIPVDELGSRESIELAASSVPTVLLDRRVTGTSAHFVGADNRLGMRLVAEHIAGCVDTDRQPVVFVGADPGSSAGHERLTAFHELFGEDAPRLVGTFDSQWGQSAAARLVDDGWHRGTIVVAADVIAIGVMNQLLARGYTVPGDFRVIGFDGIGVSRLAHPTLTTVRQPVEAMSREVLKVVQAAGGDQRRRTRRLRPSLVLGESSPADPE